MSWIYLKKKYLTKEDLILLGLDVEDVIWVKGNYIIKLKSIPSEADKQKLEQAFPSHKITDDIIPASVKSIRLEILKEKEMFKELIKEKKRHKEKR